MVSTVFFNGQGDTEAFLNSITKKSRLCEKLTNGRVSLRAHDLGLGGNRTSRVLSESQGVSMAHRLEKKESIIYPGRLQGECFLRFFAQAALFFNCSSYPINYTTRKPNAHDFKRSAKLLFRAGTGRRVLSENVVPETCI